ncbi:MAG TPA: hypothetical protein VHB50_15810, partial [Bryobacteraceae bacterium]|nr:hypothetical protein [Bryobacteraceae bacterium]
VRLSDSSIGVLNLEGAHIDGGEEFPLRADRLSVRGSVFLRRGFDCKGGVSLEDARIGGRLDCSEAVIARTTSDALSAIGLDLKGMLDFSRARIKGRIRLAAAQVGGVALLDGSAFENGAETTLGADGAQFRSAVLFRNCNMQGTVSLAFASVAATLECDGGTFSAPSADCLRLTEVRTAGSVILSSTFEGLVDLEGAQAGGDLLAGPAVFRNPGKMALRADGAVIRSSLRLDSVQVEGSVSLAVARVANSMEWQGATSVRGDVLAGEIAVQGHVITGPDLRVHGKFSMPGARIGGSLSPGGEIRGEFSIKSSEITGSVEFAKCVLGNGLQAEGAVCKSGLDFRDSFVGNGEINLAGAQISNHFSAKQATLNNPGGNALNLDNATIKGNADCERLKAIGVIRLRNAEISGDLRFSGASIVGSQGRAIRAAGCIVKSGMFLDEGFTAEGGVRLSRARITGVLNLWKTTILQPVPTEPALRLQSLDVAGRFEFRHCRIEGEIALTGASVGLMVDDFESWPAGRYRVDNFSYRALRFTGEAMPAEKRLEWLRRQKGFSLDSYEQASRVLRAAGYDRQGRSIARARRDDLRSGGNLSGFRRISNWILSVSIGHGYQLWRPLIPAAVLVAAGTFVFLAAWNEHALVPRDGKPVPFVSFMYSLDSLVPIMNFRQKDNFVFALNAPHLIWYEAYFWFHTFMGWVLSTLLVAGFASVAKRE